MAELVYPPVIAAARVLFAALGLRFTVTGSENIPGRGGAVMAINHTGYLDFTLAGYAAVPADRYVRFMAKDDIFDHRLAGPLMRGMKHIPVDRDAGAASLAAAVSALRRGEIVGVFPEATMSPSYELLPFKQGTARMAIEAEVPVLPTIIWGSQRIYTYDHRKRLRQRRLPITVTVGQPLQLTASDGVSGGTRRLRQVMTQMLHEAQETYPQAPAGPGDRWWLPARMGGTAVSPEQGLALVNARRKKEAAAGGPA